MGYLADIYVLTTSRSKKTGLDFLNHFLPLREEITDYYDIPQYADDPTQVFNKADDLMMFMELNKAYKHSIYWKNLDDKNGMIFYTQDGYMICGISRNADMSGNLNTENEDQCLHEMKTYFKTEMAYIHYENPPVGSYDEFAEIVKHLKK